MTPEEVQRAMSENLLQAQTLGLQHEAAFKLFQGFCLNNDGISADRQRAMLHTLLDSQLDLISTQMMLLRRANGA